MQFSDGTTEKMLESFEADSKAQFIQRTREAIRREIGEVEDRTSGNPVGTYLKRLGEVADEPSAPVSNDGDMHGTANHPYEVRAVTGQISFAFHSSYDQLTRTERFKTPSMIDGGFIGMRTQNGSFYMLGRRNFTVMPDGLIPDRLRELAHAITDGAVTTERSDLTIEQEAKMWREYLGGLQSDSIIADRRRWLTMLRDNWYGAYMMYGFSDELLQMERSEASMKTATEVKAQQMAAIMNMQNDPRLKAAAEKMMEPFMKQCMDTVFGKLQPNWAVIDKSAPTMVTIKKMPPAPAVPAVQTVVTRHGITLRSDMPGAKVGQQPPVRKDVKRDSYRLPPKTLSRRLDEIGFYQGGPTEYHLVRAVGESTPDMIEV